MNFSPSYHTDIAFLPYKPSYSNNTIVAFLPKKIILFYHKILTRIFYHTNVRVSGSLTKCLSLLLRVESSLLAQTGDILFICEANQYPHLCVCVSVCSQFCKKFYDFVWLCMTVYDYVWLCMTKYDYVWLCITMFDYVWICMNMFDYVLLCLTMYAFVCLCMNMFGYVWLCMPMYDYV